MASVAALSSAARPDGRIADNIVYFARALRKAGMRVGPASVKDAIEAVHAQKVVLNCAKLDRGLRSAINHAHNAEVPGL